MWTPISLIDLHRLITAGEESMSEVDLRLWRLIRIEPEKWQQQPWGEEGGGFWVVATLGRHALWYNDIEEGFNFSTCARPGTIEQYLCDQHDLRVAVSSIRQYIESGEAFMVSGPPETLQS